MRASIEFLEPAADGGPAGVPVLGGAFFGSLPNSLVRRGISMNRYSADRGRKHAGLLASRRVDFTIQPSQQMLCRSGTTFGRQPLERRPDLCYS